MSLVNVSGQNQLLSLLVAPERARIMQLCERVHLEQRIVLYEAGDEIDEVYFPLSGMVSLVMTSEEGQTVEVGTIGNEGMLGTQLVLASGNSHLEALIQVEGDFLRMSRDDLEAELACDGGLRVVAARFAQTLADQIAQSVLCNGVHSVEQRLCRWFLMVHDRAGTDEICLTQHFVAQMLGVRRPSVTVAVGMLKKAGLVTYSRGRLGILDRKALEEGACECYDTVRQQTERMLRLKARSAGAPTSMLERF
jgi:CRP-like cAMP-binding protein